MRIVREGWAECAGGRVLSLSRGRHLVLPSGSGLRPSPPLARPHPPAFRGVQSEHEGGSRWTNAVTGRGNAIILRPFPPLARPPPPSVRGSEGWTRGGVISRPVIPDRWEKSSIKYICNPSYVLQHQRIPPGQMGNSIPLMDQNPSVYPQSPHDPKNISIESVS